MAGPLATIWDVYQKGTLTKSVSPPVWIVLIGALGLVIGLATYGEADKALATLCEGTSVSTACVVVTQLAALEEISVEMPLAVSTIHMLYPS